MNFSMFYLYNLVHKLKFPIEVMHLGVGAIKSGRHLAALAAHFLHVLFQ